MKQILAKREVEVKQAIERQKKTFTDAGISIMTVKGEAKFTQNTAQEFKKIMNEDKAIRY